MGKKHGAKEQKKAAKQKAKRREKHAELLRRTSTDPTVRFKQAAKWPVVEALVSRELWDDGIGYLVIARQEAGSHGQYVFGLFLVDVFCLGVKDAFWKVGTLGDFKELVLRLSENQTMVPISPACLVKIIEGAIAFARSFGFSSHHDYRNVSLLLQGIEPSDCTNEYTYGKDGKPYYFRGPNETLEEARAISERVAEAGGHYMVAIPDTFASEPFDDLDEFDDEFEENEDEDEDGEDNPALPAP